jgi:integrase
MPRQAGIRARHSRRCASAEGRRCNCHPSYEASVFSVRDGKKIRKTHPTEAAARTWRADALGAVGRGALRTAAATTLREAFEAFLAGARDGAIRDRKGHVYKASTIRRWESALTTKRDRDGKPIAHRRRGEPERTGFSLLDELGPKRLADIGRNDLQDVIERMLGWGLDPSSIRNTMNALRPVFRRAVNRNELIVNPTRGLEIPAPKGKRLRIADPVEAAALIGATTKADQTLWATACYAGLRLGELQALRWGCVDLAKGLIRVEWSYDPKEHKFIDVKSSASNRNVPIPAALRDHLLELKLDTLRGDEDLVFGRTTATPFIGANVHSRACTKWRKASLTPLGFHEARHTFASLMIAADVNVKAISTYMGHASVKITLDRYGHLMPNSESEAAARLDAYLVRASCAPVRASSERISADHSGNAAEGEAAQTGPTMRVSA